MFGQRFGHLVVIGHASTAAYLSKVTRVSVRCDCGRLSQKIKHYVKVGRAKCCGHDLCPYRIGRRKDLTGQKFGKLTVLRPDKNHKIRERLKWLVQCECGHEKLVLSKHLRVGGTLACGDPGCSRNGHGMSSKPIYQVWQKMIARCENPRDRFWHCYGGRGIKVCRRWRKFIAFYDDMGERPSSDHSLDRIDNNKNYTPSNCRWATGEQQANNTRANVMLTHKNTTMTQSQWERKLGLSPGTIGARKYYGWTGIDLFLPRQRHSPRKGIKMKKQD